MREERSRKPIRLRTNWPTRRTSPGERQPEPVVASHGAPARVRFLAPHTIIRVPAAGDSSSEERHAGLTDDDLPEVFRTADRCSVEAQGRFLRSLRVELVALAVGAAFGAYSWTWPGTQTDIAAVVAAIAFGCAAVLRGAIKRGKPERSWYDGRAAAESAKTLAWRYAVGGNPFPRDLDEVEADRELVGRLGELPATLANLDIVPSSDQGRQITPAMRALRRLPLEERKAAYDEGRIREQQAWYSRRAWLNRSRAARWNWLLITIEVLGAVGAALKATTEISIEVLPVTAAVVAGATAYLQTKQHDSLASAYAVASLELASVGELLAGVTNEHHWAGFVDQAENAISREHTMWKATRSTRKQLTEG